MVESFKRKQHQESRKKDVYVAYFDDNMHCLLEHYNEERLFIVRAGSEIRFRLRKGTLYSNKPILIVNLPQIQQVASVASPLKTQINQSQFEEESKDQVQGDLRSEKMTSEAYSHLQLQIEGITNNQLLRVVPQSANQTTYFEFIVNFNEAGSFFVQIEYDIQEPSQAQGKIELACQRCLSLSSYINVEPVLKLFSNEPDGSISTREIQCKELSICSVLTRCLGPLTRWYDVLKPVSLQGYNTIHFTPLQKYGASRSLYSLADQTNIDDCFFQSESQMINSSQGQTQQKGSDIDSRFNQLRETVKRLREEQGLLSIIDIVLNHTANNSDWIADHPEACFSTDIIPRLWPAWLVDDTFTKLSDDFQRGNVTWCKSAPYLNNEAELTLIIEEMRKRVNALNLHEYFMISEIKNDALMTNSGLSFGEIEVHLKRFSDLKKRKPMDDFEFMEQYLISKLGEGPQRGQTTLKMPDTAVYFVNKHFQNVTNAFTDVQKLIKRHNEHWKEKLASYINEAMENSRGTIRYWKIEKKNPKITVDESLQPPYFQVLNNTQRSKVVHNGWICDNDPQDDFAEEKNFYFLRRGINIWGDSIKLRYGQSPEDSPFLWAHMAKYVSQMAITFDGFRLDNAHSTPIHVCQYLLQVARSQNSNLFIMAELFTPSLKIDVAFAQKLNINGMVRELQNRQDAEGVGSYFHQLTCQEAVIGKVNVQTEDINSNSDQSQLFQTLLPVKLRDVIYDCTHDNPSPLEKFGTRRLSLPQMGLLSMADIIIGSTWGFDQMLLRKISVVTEERLYPIEENFKWPKPLEPFQIQPFQSSKQKENSQFCFQFEFFAPDAQKVAVAGTFNEWKPDLILERDNSGNWRKQHFFDQKQESQVHYKFVINEKDWVFDSKQSTTKDKHGNCNNYFEITHKKQNIPIMPNFFDQTEKCYPNIRLLRMIMNRVHSICNQHNAEIYMHTQTDDTIVVVRQFALDLNKDFDAYTIITRFCFNDVKDQAQNIKTTVDLPGFLSEIVFVSTIVDKMTPLPPGSDPKEKDSKGFIDIPKSSVIVNASLKKYANVIYDAENKGAHSQLEFFNLPSCFVCLVKTTTKQQHKEAVLQLNELNQKSCARLAMELFSETDLAEFNHLLFRCSGEENDITPAQPRGPYGLKSGQFKYAGLQSIIHLIEKLKITGDMGSELFDNIRGGDWLLNYTQQRIQSELKDMPGLVKLNEFLLQTFSLINSLPIALKPKYFCAVIEKIYSAAVRKVLRTQDIQSGDLFVQRLVLASVQMYGRIPSAYFAEFKDSMCAGLPHFSTGYMRCWGRDTFISFKGLLLINGRYKEARDTIIKFAMVERHGLIPNLLDQGKNTRFNARDATWFFLQAIKDFINIAPEGHEILRESFPLVFESNRKTTIEQLIFKILQNHSDGIEFREWNAGLKIDSQMKDNGFNISIKTDWVETGFIFGGNKDNCGTWMDKMGSAQTNKGVPATPRDGAPIELVALQYSVISFLDLLNEKGLFSAQGVKQGSFKEWAQRIKHSFEENFYIPERDETWTHKIDQKLINRSGIYKDLYGSSQPHTDYQLRPNVCIAMAVAPELFTPARARRCLEIVEQVLMSEGAMGIKTLDPTDRQYNGNYVNSDQTCGHNYHQGPEWLWPVGFFLQAKLKFIEYRTIEEAQQSILKHLLPHQDHIATDPWYSLPELTNSGGKFCADSCPAQAWSVAAILDALHDLSLYKLQN